MAQKAQHAILRFAKHKAGPAGALEAHHERTKEQYASNPDIDKSRSKDNFHIVQPTQKYRKEIDSRIKAAGCKTRSTVMRPISFACLSMGGLVLSTPSARVKLRI